MKRILRAQYGLALFVIWLVVATAVAAFELATPWFDADAWAILPSLTATGVCLVLGWWVYR